MAEAQPSTGRPADLGRLHTARTRAESFGRVARQYDRYRPTYPAALVDDLLAPGPRTVLDIGCGTGRLGSLLAARGLDVLGVEPDPDMAAVAREHGLRVEVAGFERWEPAGRRFDLAVCGQAWHWIDPDRGARQVAAVLRPGGMLALAWNVGTLEPAVDERVQRVYAEYAPALRRSVALGGVARGELGELRTLPAAGFGPPEHRSYAWSARLSTADWLGLLGTHSDHVTLPPGRLAALLDALRAAVGEGGVTIRYTTEVVLARLGDTG